jgi:tetratricopeptide (TPR) repeat protein
MIETLSLVERLIDRARQRMQLGYRQEAKRILDHLLTFGELPHAIREESHLLLAEIHLDGQRFRKARKHLLAILAFHPTSAKVHYQLALAIDCDPDADQRRAIKHFRKAIQLKPDESSYWSGFAQSAIRMGKNEMALKALRKATTLEIQNMEIVEEIVDAFVALGHESEADGWLRQIRFRFAKNLAFEKLWKEFRFGQSRRERLRGLPQSNGMAESSSILPFVRLMTAIAEYEVSEDSESILRYDRSSSKHTHLPRWTRNRPGPRHAN